MHPVISKKTFKENLDHLNKTIFHRKLPLEDLGTFIKMVFGEKTNAMLLVDLIERFEHIFITQESKNSEKTQLYLTIIETYKLIYAPGSEMLCEEIAKAWREVTKESIRKQLFTKFRQSVEIGKNNPNPLLLEQLILIRGLKLYNIFEGSSLQEALAVCASWRTATLSTTTHFYELCKKTPFFPDDPFQYTENWNKQNSHQDFNDSPCRKDFAPFQVSFNNVTTESMIVREIAYARQTHTKSADMTDKEVWQTLNIVSEHHECDEDILKKVSCTDLGGRNAFEKIGDNPDKLEPFIKKYLLDSIKKANVKDELYKLFVTHFHQAGIASSLWDEFHHFSNGKFLLEIECQFKTYKFSCLTQGDGFSLSVTFNIKDQITKDIIGQMTGEFIISLQDSENPGFKNFKIKLTRVLLEIQAHEKLKNKFTPLIYSLEQYQWHLNSLIFMGNLKTNLNDDISARVLNLIKEDFLTVKENPYIGDYRYTLLPELERIIATAISDYVTYPDSFNIVKSVFEPLGKINIELGKQRTFLRFHSDPEKSILQDFFRRLGTYAQSQELVSSHFLTTRANLPTPMERGR